tara:strand:- start:7890 stop:11294 length:3405 start_codon:yes stop_codon:yes gene_type:complete
MPRYQPKNNYDLSKLIEMHLENLAPSERNTSNELEVRFGTKNLHYMGIKPISKINFMNVVSKLKSLDYYTSYGNEEGNHSLKIQSEFIDPQSGVTRESGVRVEISGLPAIKQFCENNSIQASMKTNETFVRNMTLMTKKKIKGADGFDIRPVDVDAFNFRISYQSETTINSASTFAKSVISELDNSKKSFRLINRVSFVHPKYPIRVDMSIVKSSKYDEKSRKSIMVYKMEESNVLNNPEQYEIEIEVENHLLGPGRKYDKSNSAQLEKDIKQVITHILSGLQETNYPVSYVEQGNVKSEYLKLLYGKDVPDRKLYSNDFCGPSSYTLQTKHIQEVSEEVITPNIRDYYTVTEKADGSRKLLFVNNKGRIYLITTGMQVQYTGVTITNKKLYNSLLDGEHILHNKVRQFINYYGAFDIYFINGRSVRDKGFMYLEEDAIKENYRLPLLTEFINEMNVKKDSKDMEYPINIHSKNFLVDVNGDNIFSLCGELLKRTKSNYFEYETDGLIFTPIKNAVAGNKEGRAGSMRKPTWDYSFKWKPPQYNTIDFLITTKKTENKQDIVGNIFTSGTDLSLPNQINQYKVIELRVGFDRQKHGYINPCNDVIHDRISSIEDIDNEDTYKPLPFHPTNPVDSETHICHILLKQDDSGNYQMITEEGEVFDDKMIVEFRYDFTREKHYNWVPLRVRYDKTAAFKNNEKEYGNAYHVANSNWYSIHNPITEEMLSSGDNIPDNISAEDDGVYYNRKGDRSVGKNTICMRNFHNKYVKQKLIMNIAKRGNTLIDLAVGQGGDLTKWIDAKLDFVFGVDISPDNIENMSDGACTRYLNKRKELKVMPKALFVNGNSGKNLKRGDALFTEKDKLITNAVFGSGPKDVSVLGKGVFNQYGKGSQGFDICSCQFALHYFFEDKDKLSAFVTNVCETTKLNGYFIGTCYDGKKIFNSLRSKKQGESMILMNKDVKVWEINKLYGHEDFKNDITSLGYDIEVYQESINKPAIEYLVNFDYFQIVMERFGFAILTPQECREVGLPHSMGSFEELFVNMNNEIMRNKKIEKEYGCAKNMTTYEKQISFYNNYFVFKKIHEVDPSQLQLVDTSMATEVATEVETVVGEIMATSEVKTQPKSKKRSVKTKLVNKE